MAKQAETAQEFWNRLNAEERLRKGDPEPMRNYANVPRIPKGKECPPGAWGAPQLRLDEPMTDGGELARDQVEAPEETLLAGGVMTWDDMKGAQTSDELAKLVTRPAPSGWPFPASAHAWNEAAPIPASAWDNLKPAPVASGKPVPPGAWDPK